MNMAEAFHGLVDGKEYKLNIGSSFKKRQSDGIYHAVRYDFKPASVDSSKASELIVGSNNDVTVKVPHIQESGSTVFKGSKRPCAKDCVLIIDKDTGEVTLEKLASNIQLKKIRSANHSIAKTISQPGQPVAKVSTKPSVHKQRVASKGDNVPGKAETEPNKVENKPKERIAEKPPPTSIKNVEAIGNDLKPPHNNGSGSPSSAGSDSDSSSSGTDSDSDQDDLETREQAKALDKALMQENIQEAGNRNWIDDDLKLTDSDSD
ncbi:ELL-associated factor 1-like [Rhopilema esculentum]|uniref:ELL-associated factor 1-like n=1 Tax=Rhopilema esculentum TaxID=499914 RepID=UPI0031E0875E